MKPRTKEMVKRPTSGTAKLGIADVIEQLPLQLQQEVRSYAEYLRATRPQPHHRKMLLKWAGGLREFRGQCTALSLPKQSLDWWPT